MEPGDCILFFDDGVNEIQNAGKEWLGAEGFIQILLDPDYPKTPLSMDTPVEELLKFSKDIRLQDDITTEHASRAKTPHDCGSRVLFFNFALQQFAGRIFGQPVNNDKLLWYFERC